MKTNKDKVYSLLSKHYMKGKSRGVTTKTISETLDIGRTNVSTILNALVSEGLAAKTNSRPVLYFAVSKKQKNKDIFDTFIGGDGSLKHAIQLAKAAVLYPQGSLDTLIIGASGTGKKLLSQLIYKYAVVNGVISRDSDYAILDCQQYSSVEIIIDKLFGPAQLYSCSKNGILVIENANRFSYQSISKLFRLIENKKTEANNENATHPMIIMLINTNNQNVANDFKKHFPVIIELPLLNERPLKERFELVQHFITVEATRAKRTISTNSELMRCLLLYDVEFNVASLKYDIKMGCANAYVREHSIDSSTMNLYLGDFEYYVRKGFLHYYSNKKEIEKIISQDYDYKFSEYNFEKTAVKTKSDMLYQVIDFYSRQLEEQGVPANEINKVIVSQIEAEFQAYHDELADKLVHTNELSLVIDNNIINIVKKFLKNAEKELDEKYPQSIFYGLCLHLDTTLKNGFKKSNLTKAQMNQIVENYKLEYSLCLKLASTIEKEYDIKLPLDEVVLLTTFISFKAKPTDTNNKPVILYALCGSGLAKAFTILVNQALNLDNAFHIEIPLDYDPLKFYEQLCAKIKKINRNQGVIVVYDTDYISYLLSTIEAETGIEIRKIYTPYSNMALELSRNAAVESDIEKVFQKLKGTMEHLQKPRQKVIVDRKSVV